MITQKNIEDLKKMIKKEEDTNKIFIIKQLKQK